MKTLLLPLMIGCAPAYENADVKMVGVGYDPEEIAPPSEPSGGLLEYSYVDFAGDALTLGMMGFSGHDLIGPDLAGSNPPYAMAYGFGYIFSHKLPGAEALGLTQPPSDVEGACYTSYSPAGPLGSFETVDVGTTIVIGDAEGTSGLVLPRYPTDYPGDPQDTYAFYSGFDLYRATPVTALIPGGNEKPSSMSTVTYQRASFPFGEELEISFSGGFAPDGAPLSSMPQPSSSVGNGSLRLPSAVGGVMMSWNGPQYNSNGKADGEDAAVSTCLRYLAGDAAPATPEDCAGAGVAGAGGGVGVGVSGQMYTGPWDTTDGNVSFHWVPAEASDDFVSLSVRFLGAVDETDLSLLEEVVDADSNNRRAPTACEDDASWELDETIYDKDGDFVPWMRGDPANVVAEVTCRLKESGGEFILTGAMLENALTYARAHGAEGATFYFARGVQADMTVPDVRDSYGQRHSVSPVKVTSRAVQIGRFWYEE